MVTAAAGPLSLTKDRARKLIAECATFISAAGAASAAAAYANNTHQTALPAPSGIEFTLAELNGYRPFAIAFLPIDGGFTASRVAGGGAFGWEDSGAVLLHVEADVAAGDVDDPAEASAKFENLLGQIIAEMKVLAGAAGTVSVGGSTEHLRVSEISIVEGPIRNHEDEAQKNGDFMYAILQIDWN